MKILSFLVLLSVSANKLPSVTLNKYNHVSLIGEVNAQSVDHVIDGMNRIDFESIYLYIDSPGGYVNDGEKLVSYILYNQANGREVVCIAENAYSMAFYILQNCKYRWVTPSARLMQHQVSLKNDGSLLSIGNYLDMVNKVSKKLNQVCAQRIGLSEDAFIDKVRDDWWLFGDDIIIQNAADAQVLVGCNSTVEFQIDTSQHKVESIGHPCPITSKSKIITTKSLATKQEQTVSPPVIYF
jgi:ATP-dependent Clp protease protease subunit